MFRIVSFIGEIANVDSPGMTRRESFSGTAGPLPMSHKFRAGHREALRLRDLEVERRGRLRVGEDGHLGVRAAVAVRVVLRGHASSDERFDTGKFGIFQPNDQNL